MSYRVLLSTALLLLIAPVALWAHGPTPQSVSESIHIDVDPDAVWNLVGDFGSIGDWHPLIAGMEASGDNEPGSARRQLTLDNGESVVESLDSYREEDRRYGYRLAKENFDALPVSFYTAFITVSAGEEGGTRVEWLGRFYRADTGNFPAEEHNDKAAVDAMTEFFQQGLQGLKDALESAK